MSSVEVTVALQARIAELARWLDEAHVLDKEHRAVQVRLDDETAAAWTRLAAVLLPRLTPEALDQAAATLDLPSLAEDVVLAERDAAKAHHEAASAAARADPAFRNAAPMRALLDARAQDMTAHAELLRRSVRELEQIPRFLELFETGYGTTDDDARWWTPTGIKRKSAAEAVVASVGKRRGAHDFAQLRAQHAAEKEALATYDDDLGELRATAAHLDALVAQADAAARALAALDDLVLARTRQRIVDALAGLPETTWLHVAGDAPGARDALRELSAMHAKRRYVDALFDHWVQKARSDVLGLARDYEALAEDHVGGPTFFARPTHTVTDVERRASAMLAGADERLRTYRAVRGRILAFEHSASVDPTRDLWWDAMVGASIDGSFVDEVTWHRATRAPAQVSRPTRAAPRPAPTPAHADTSTSTRAWSDAARRAEDRLAERLASLPDAEDDADREARAADEAEARGGPAPIDLPPVPVKQRP